jgi:2-keto-4-pentenoate hydratase
MNDGAALVEAVAGAITRHQKIGVLPSGLSVAQAYEVQHRVAEVVSGNNVIGIKAGVTAEPVQQFLGLSSPVIGSLYGGGKLLSGCELRVEEGSLLECEVGVLLDSDGKPKAILPVIEVVLLGFERDEDLTGANVIAANMGADRVICGEPIAWESRPAQIDINFAFNEGIVCTASSNDSLGGVESGVNWMLEEADRRGFCVGEDSLLILGTCGSAVPALSGSYKANYGELGGVEFTVI